MKASGNNFPSVRHEHVALEIHRRLSLVRQRRSRSPQNRRHTIPVVHTISLIAAFNLVGASIHTTSPHGKQAKLLHHTEQCLW